MWHCIVPVVAGGESVMCEAREPLTLVVCNAGPATIELVAWQAGSSDACMHPDLRLELRPGAQRVLTAAVVRARVRGEDKFAAAGARVLGVLAGTG